MSVTDWIWRALVALTLMSGLAWVSGACGALPNVWQGVTIVPGLVVAVCIVVAAYADSRPGSGR